MLQQMNLSSTAQLCSEMNRYFPDGEQMIATLDDSLAMTSQALRVTAFGLLKAGKSSLLNALTDHIEVELFATGAARTTIQNQTFFQQDCIFVDTPGLDATINDDIETWKALNSADILLFVHDPGIGELHLDEVDFVAKINQSSGGRVGLETRLVTILTRLDSNSEAIDAIAEKIQCQMMECLAFRPPLFQISSSSYRKGKLQNSQPLVKYSGIPALQQYLSDNLTSMRAKTKALRQGRIDRGREQLMNAIDAEIAKRAGEIMQLQAESDQVHQVLGIDSNTLINTLRGKISAYCEKY